MDIDFLFRIFSERYSWLTPEEALTTATKVVERLGSIYSASEFAAAVEAEGLAASVSLIIDICGGSKTTAGKIIRDQARKRYLTAQQAVVQTQPSSEIDFEQLSKLIHDALTGQQAAAAIPDQIITSIAGIDRNIASLAGNVGWLKTMIDSERQLHRYQNRFGSLDEPRATPLDRKAVISDLTTSLAKKNESGRSE